MISRTISKKGCCMVFEMDYHIMVFDTVLLDDHELVGDVMLDHQ